MPLKNDPPRPARPGQHQPSQQSRQPNRRQGLYAVTRFGKKPCRYFKLLVGIHIGPDYTQEPDEQTGRYPSKTYHAGQTVPDPGDLRKLHGDQKFQEVGGSNLLQTPGDVTDQSEEENPATFPHGQVSTGFQEATSTQVGQPAQVPQGPPSHVAEQGTEHDEAAREEPEPAPAEEVNLDDMNMRQLRQHAEERGVDLHGAKSRAEIVERIQSKRK